MNEYFASRVSVTEAGCWEWQRWRLLTSSENASHQLDSYKTHCKRGHEFTPENTRVKEYGRGRRDCKTCHRDRERARQQAARKRVAA